MPSKVFVSHSSKDMQIAARLYRDLQQRDVVCWMAPDDIEPGLDYQSSIVRAIRTAKVMLLVFTRNANDSREVSKEIALANKYGLLIIPARIDDVTPNDALEYELTTRQWHDLDGDWHGAMDGLAERIKRAHREGEPSAADSTVRAETVSPLETPTPRVKVRPAERKTPPPERAPAGGRTSPPVTSFNMTTNIQLQWAGFALIALAVAHIVCLAMVASDGSIDEEALWAMAGVFLVFVGELAIGAYVLQEKFWARWPALAICVIGFGFSLWLAVALGQEGSENVLENTVLGVSAVGVLGFGLSGAMLFRWQPSPSDATAAGMAK